MVEVRGLMQLNGRNGSVRINTWLYFKMKWQTPYIPEHLIFIKKMTNTRSVPHRLWLCCLRHWHNQVDCIHSGLEQYLKCRYPRYSKYSAYFNLNIPSQVMPSRLLLPGSSLGALQWLEPSPRPDVWSLPPWSDFSLIFIDLIWRMHHQDQMYGRCYYGES